MHVAKLRATRQGRSKTTALGGRLFIVHCAVGSWKSTVLTVANAEIKRGVTTDQNHRGD